MYVKYSVEYVLEVSPSKNGSFDFVQSGSQGILTPYPNEGYVVKDVEIKDTKGQDVVYQEKDEKYVVELYDDVIANVTFEKIKEEAPVVDKEEVENPKTGVEDYLVPLVLVLSSCGGAYYLVNKKNIFKRI